MTQVSTRAAVFDRDGGVAVRDVPLRPLDAGELLVRVRACGICASEAMPWYARAKAPFTLGHEPVATVEETGGRARGIQPGASPFRAGERVFVHHHAPCLTCRACRRGDFVQCATWRATRLDPGGVSQFAVVPRPNVEADVLRLPDTLDDDVGTLIEPLATVVKSMRRAGMRRGDTMLTIGLGVMGLLHVILARKRGAQRIVGTDFVASRREAALAHGADAAFDPDDPALPRRVSEALGAEGADIVIVGPGGARAIDQATRCVAPGGSIVFFTPLPPDERWAMPQNELYFKDVTIANSYSAGPDDTREALALLTAGLPVASLITHRFALDDAAAAYATVARATDALKVIVYPGAR